MSNLTAGSPKLMACGHGTYKYIDGKPVCMKCLWTKRKEQAQTVVELDLDPAVEPFVLAAFMIGYESSDASSMLHCGGCGTYERAGHDDWCIVTVASKASGLIPHQDHFKIRWTKSDE